MATHTAIPGTKVALDGWSAANVNDLPGGWLGHVSITASQGSIGSTATDITGLSVAVTVNTSRRIRAHAYFPSWLSTVNGDNASLLIMEGATQLTLKRGAAVSSGTGDFGIEATWIGIPSAGSHTYKVQFVRVSGTGTLTVGASSTQPAFLLVEDIGPA